MAVTGFDRVADKGYNIVTEEGKGAESSYKEHTTGPEYRERR